MNFNMFTPSFYWSSHCVLHTVLLTVETSLTFYRVSLVTVTFKICGVTLLKLVMLPNPYEKKYWLC